MQLLGTYLPQEKPSPVFTYSDVFHKNVTLVSPSLQNGWANCDGDQNVK